MPIKVQGITPCYLIIGPSWVGDMVMAQSVFITLKQQHPECNIDVLAPKWSASLLQCMPQVRDAISVDLPHGKLQLRQRWRYAKTLRSKNYTHAIVLPNSIKSALIPFFAKIPQRIGYIGEQRWGLLNQPLRLDKKNLATTVQRFVYLADKSTLALSNIPKPKLSLKALSQQHTLQQFSLTTLKKTLVLCPGAEFGPSKQWPSRYFAELAQHYLEKNWQVWLVGSKSDIAISEEIHQKSQKKTQQLAGKTSLKQVIEIISHADMVVSNDSGLMHIGAACDVPVVALYGSTDPSHTPPLSNKIRIQTHSTPCQPCFKRHCPLHHHECMQKLSSAQVINAIDSLQ